MTDNSKKYTYTCNDYRDEMILVSLKKRFEDEGLSDEERECLQEQIARLEEKMGL